MTEERSSDSAGEQPEHKPVRPRRSARSSRSSASRNAKKSTSAWRSVKEILIVVVLAILIAFIVKTLFIRGFYIPSGSMENTLELNDRIFVNVMNANLGNIDRGDIVVFHDTKNWLPAQPQGSDGVGGAVRSALSFVGILPDTGDQALVKRVIGQGGDHVVCCDADGRVTVNGTALDETYVYPGAAPSEIPFDVIVPDDHYFVLGDHRNASADSRVHLAQDNAFIRKDDIIGTAFVIAWPLDRFHILHHPDQVFADVPAAGSSDN
ncbi:MULTISPECIES: signal peptidase I [unclassified Candidatus Sulfotelmatobacter]|uniref:signal peptidase I n=1 Tax=unclassified Candidatus Sulfotelmatobacter TaxID=2635724 RepID=UPI0028043D6D|nr:MULTISPECIES: signal peptidase I [unclassified Candidatus Sulfotelmatobacter]